jgi:hypothetical protein
MLNSAPNQNGKYKQGLFIPKNKNKCIKLNNQGGLFYRSSLEQKFMIYLDNNNNIIHWNTELIKIPYTKNAWNNKLLEMTLTEHTYFPDFYYEIKKADGSIARVVAEIKPDHETKPPKLQQNPTAKQMKNFEYSLKEYAKNLDKWKYCIEWCKMKGFEFIIITDRHLNPGKDLRKKV